MLRSGARLIRLGAISRRYNNARPHIQVRWNAQVAEGLRRFVPQTPNGIPYEAGVFEIKGKERSADGSKKKARRKRTKAKNLDEEKKPRRLTRPKNSGSEKKTERLTSATDLEAEKERRKAAKEKKSVDRVLYTKDHIQSVYEVPTASQLGLSFDPVADLPKLISEADLYPEICPMKTLSPRLFEGQHIVEVLLRVTLGDGRSLQVQGHGATIKEATAAAELHLVCQLYKSGDLNSQSFRLGELALLREAGAKKDIINYAARHDCLPTFSVRREKRSAFKKLYRAHVSIPSLGLDCYGRASGEKKALLKACISLKDAAEARHRLTGEGTFLVKDYTSLNTDSSEKFLAFYCNQQQVERSLKTIEPKAGVPNALWVAKVTLKSATIQNNQKDRSLSSPARRPFFDSDAWPGALGGEGVTWEFEGMPMATRSDAEDVGYLAAALALKKESPSLWAIFAREMKRGNGDMLRRVSPIDFTISPDAVDVMKVTLDDTAAAENDTDVSPNKLDTLLQRKRRTRRQLTPQLTESEIKDKSKELEEQLKSYETDPSLAQMRDLRSNLPMSQYRNQVVEMINENDSCVVIGATGSGKTTQVPQLVLEDLIRQGNGGACNIMCTQPRRIAAISVAERVAAERNEELGESVGYTIRFKSRPPKHGGSIHYCTTGVLLKMLQENQTETLNGISHIIVDEVHERDLDNDFLLVVLKNLMQERKAAGQPVIKLILMSATIDPSLFCRYFGDGYPDNMCPHIKVPGRTFPVTTHFLDDIYSNLTRTYPSKATAMDLYSKESDGYISRELDSRTTANSEDPASKDTSNDKMAIIDWRSKGLVGEDGELEVVMDRQDIMTPIGLMAVTIAHLLKTTSEGSVLAFLPGLQEILSLERSLKEKSPLGINFLDNPNCKVFVLHSSLPQMQQEVFAKVLPGQRKVILATNIAETSITIPDVVYVVDSSKQREMQYDESRRISTLTSTWTARSNAQQRAGRAGRVQNGHYYTMASKARYESFEIAPKPEMQRTPLQSICLRIKSMGIEDVWGFLKSAINSPSQSAVETAIKELQALGAFDNKSSLTPLGRYLAALPLAPSIGKMVVLAAIFRCLDPILIMAAMSTTKSPFLNPPGKKKQADWYKAKWARGSNNDHAAVINAFREWRREQRSGRGSHQPGRAFAHENFLHHDTLCQMARVADQILFTLQTSGLVETPVQAMMVNGVAAQYGSASENMFSKSEAVQIAMATAGFFPNIAVRNKFVGPRYVRTVHENQATISPYSQAAPRGPDGEISRKVTNQMAAPHGTLFTFAQKAQSDDNGVELRVVARTYPLAVCLFGGQWSRQGSILTVDEWLPFLLKKRGDIFLLGNFRNALERLLDRTLNRLAVPIEDRPQSKERFLDQDKARGVLVMGIVEALELSSPKGPLAVGGLLETSKSNYDSKERSHAELLRNWNSSPSPLPAFAQPRSRQARDTRSRSGEESFTELLQHFNISSSSESKRPVQSDRTRDPSRLRDDQNYSDAVGYVPAEPVKPVARVKPVKPSAELLLNFSSQWKIVARDTPTHTKRQSGNMFWGGITKLPETKREDKGNEALMRNREETKEMMGVLEEWHK